jgi:acetyltransferase-like isoleucine patch superfamily enzyme
MSFGPTTMSRAELKEALSAATRYPHANVHKGSVIISSQAFQSEGYETNVLISRFSLIDCTGFIHIGPWCNITARCRIYTHDHIHVGRQPLLAMEAQYGVIWQDKYIGADVCIYDGAIVLYHVTHIPDGVIIGAGSVVTENPGPYEIWAGVPARKIGERGDADHDAIKKIIGRERFQLSHSLKSQGEKWY